MKIRKLRIFLVICLLVVLFLWNFKREVALTLLPIAITLNNPVAENREIIWPVADLNENNGRPNIILILADDLGFNDVSYYNGGAADGSLLTPNIDSLAREGVAFLNGYAASPVCSPSRAARRGA